MFNISGVMVVYNEENVIRKSLECLKKFTDEIVVFDSFSTDSTPEILKEFGCRVFQHEFDNHRDQKNRALKECKQDWTFLLDADEYLDDKLIRNIPNLISNQEGIDAFAFPRKNYIDGDGPHGFPDVQTRLFLGRGKILHFGHPFHHGADANAKKSAVVMDFGCIVHEKSMKRQEKQNRLYYTLRPQDYNNIPPNGAEDVVINQELTKDANNINVYRDYLTKEL